MSPKFRAMTPTHIPPHLFREGQTKDADVIFHRLEQQARAVASQHKYILKIEEPQFLQSRVA